MDWSISIPLAAIIVAIGGTLMTGLSNMQTRAQSASRDYVRQLEQRVDEYKEEVRHLRDERNRMTEKMDGLLRENVELRIRVLELERKVKAHDEV